MGIPPGAEFAVAGYIFITHIVASDQGHPPIHYNDLSVVAKIDLKSIGFSLGRMKGRDMNAGLFQFIGILPGQSLTADLVI
jgi:hypothetical protein